MAQCHGGDLDLVGDSEVGRLLKEDVELAELSVSPRQTAGANAIHEQVA